MDVVAALAWPCHRRRWPEHHHLPLPSRHAHWRGSSGDPLSKPRVLVDARDDGEHNGGDLVVGDLVVGEFSSVKAPPLFYFTIMWGRVDCGTHASIAAGCIDRVHLAFRV